jgi:hypothetical protein
MSDDFGEPLELQGVNKSVNKPSEKRPNSSEPEESVFGSAERF